MDSNWVEDYTEFEKDIELNLIIPEKCFICCYPRTHTNDDHPDKEYFSIEWVFAGAEYVREKETKSNNRKPKAKSHRKRTRHESK